MSLAALASAWLLAKNIRLAVHRNRVKRQARETFRHQSMDLPAVDIIFLARRGLDEPDTNINEILSNAWIKLSHDMRGAK